LLRSSYAALSPLQALPRPPNDNCEGAITIDTSTGLLTSTNRAALPQFESVECDINRGSRVLWYSFTPSETAVYRVLITEYEWNMVVSVFEGDCEMPACRATGNFCAIPIAVFPFVVYCDFDVLFTGIVGNTYRIAISGKDGFGPEGLFSMNLLVSTLSQDDCLLQNIT